MYSPPMSAVHDIQRDALLLAKRSDIRSLSSKWDRRLHELQSRSSGICNKRETLYADIFTRLIKQVEAVSPESGAILTSLKNERRMTLACRLELHQNATELGIQEATGADFAVFALSERYARLVAEITALKLKASSLHHEIHGMQQLKS